MTDLYPVLPSYKRGGVRPPPTEREDSQSESGSPRSSRLVRERTQVVSEQPNDSADRALVAGCELVEAEHRSLTPGRHSGGLQVVAPAATNGSRNGCPSGFRTTFGEAAGSSPVTKPAADKFALVVDMFHRVVDLAESERRALFATEAVPAEVATEVEALLETSGDFANDVLEAAVPQLVLAPEAASALVPGAVFGDYEIVREIARGGMGAVFEARQRSLGRTIALKVILGSRFATAAEVKRFQVEAESVARTESPGHRSRLRGRRAGRRALLHDGFHRGRFAREGLGTDGPARGGTHRETGRRSDPLRPRPQRRAPRPHAGQRPAERVRRAAGQ